MSFMSSRPRRLPVELHLRILSELYAISAPAAVRSMAVCRLWHRELKNDVKLYRDPFADLDCDAMYPERMSQLLDVLIRDCMGASGGGGKCGLVQSFELHDFPNLEDADEFSPPSNASIYSTSFNNVLYPTIGAQLAAVLPRFTNLRSLTLRTVRVSDWAAHFIGAQNGAGMLILPALERITLTVEWLEALPCFICAHPSLSEINLIDIEIDANGRPRNKEFYINAMAFLGPMLPNLEVIKGNMHSALSLVRNRPVQSIKCTQRLAFGLQVDEKEYFHRTIPEMVPEWMSRTLLTAGIVPLQELVLEHVFASTFWDLLGEISRAGVSAAGEGGLKVLRIMREVRVKEDLFKHSSSELRPSVDPTSTIRSGRNKFEDTSNHALHARIPIFPALTSLSLGFNFYTQATEYGDYPYSPVNMSPYGTLPPPYEDVMTQRGEEEYCCDALSAIRRCPKLERLVCGLWGNLWVRVPDGLSWELENDSEESVANHRHESNRHLASSIPHIGGQV